MLSTAPLATVLADADLAYLAVESRSGPMVTPLLFAVQDDRIWMVVPRSSAKVAAIGRNAVVGLAVGRPGTCAVVQGEARLVDPLKPSALLTSLPEALRAPRGLGRYVVDNLDHVAGIVGGAGTGLLSPRTVAALRPARALVQEPGSAALWSAGAWPEGAEPYGPGDVRATPMDAVPADVRTLAKVDAPVVVGWTTTAGPVALPATWDASSGSARIDGDLFRAAGCLPQSRACVLFDGTEGTALDGKSGFVVRGRGSAVGHGADAAIALRTERVTWWHGTESHTTKAG